MIDSRLAVSVIIVVLLISLACGNNPFSGESPVPSPIASSTLTASLPEEIASFEKAPSSSKEYYLELAESYLE